ncbi:MAG: L-serine ammonia-lyase, iron-sulfur-dependent, subunit alpha [Acidaminococcales bacterium]|jgi:L-serine dehydratase|nr:L-serine ammonia-lyase, iron-sulfur-dependent, subunit alpha [Acidaminococcales bacterium]
MEKILSLQDFVEAAAAQGMSFGAYALKAQAVELEIGESELAGQMFECVEVMRAAARSGLRGQKTRGGLAGGDAQKIFRARAQKSYINITGDIVSDAIQTALAIGEANASMGKIVAAPTAGASGVIPGVLFALEKPLGLDDAAIGKGLVVAGVIGLVIASRASLSGAVGGCQAECGSAAAMAAGAAADLAGGEPAVIAHASAIAMKAMLGLICDPVAGLVEVPCIKRNAAAAVVALTAAQMALAGIKSFIPADEVFDAMKSVGASLPPSLKETSAGGIAQAPTALAWAKEHLHAD